MDVISPYFISTDFTTVVPSMSRSWRFLFYQNFKPKSYKYCWTLCSKGPAHLKLLNLRNLIVLASIDITGMNHFKILSGKVCGCGNICWICKMNCIKENLGTRLNLVYKLFLKIPKANNNNIKWNRILSITISTDISMELTYANNGVKMNSHTFERLFFKFEMDDIYRYISAPDMECV